MLTGTPSSTTWRRNGVDHETGESGPDEIVEALVSRLGSGTGFDAVASSAWNVG